jgi:hypothetical protein
MWLVLNFFWLLLQFIQSLTGVHLLGEAEFFTEAAEVDKANLFVINIR